LFTWNGADIFELAPMPELVTLKHVADLIVDRVLAETKNSAELRAALENAYPFADYPEGRQIWKDSLLRHAVEFDTQPHLKPIQSASEQHRGDSG
jgi:hypothetical protein